MTTDNCAAAKSKERISWLEDAATDFPFYRGAPVAISARQWLLILAMGAAGFLALALPIPWPAGAFWPFLPALLIMGIPLIALAYVAPGHWRAIFGKVGSREVKLMFGFALLNIVVSMTVGAIVFVLFGAAPNGSTVQLGSLDTAGRIAFFAKIIPQLLGEEIITILPFLAMLQWFSKGLGLGRKGAVVGAWLISAFMFGLIHLPTYDWNLIQCIVVIGTARLVLTLPWIMTKNIWVSTGTHIVNDWLLFVMSLLGAILVGQG